jgi:murein DD-endopeptidase MepM/ murein hydrolase activator NlpD
MNVYRAGDSNDRKPVLKSLSANPRERQSKHPPRTPVTGAPEQSQLQPIRKSAQQSQQQYDTGQVSTPSSNREPRASYAEVFNRSVSLPVWLVAVLIAALIASPTAAVLYQWSGSDSDQPEIAATIPEPTPAAVEEADEEDEIPLALEMDPGFDTRQWEEPLPSPVSQREQYLLDQGVNPDLEVRYASDEVERLQAELEAIQRNSAMLRSLARQQSGDLSEAYSSLEASQEHADGALEDLQARIDELQGRIQSVDDLARELRDILGMAPSDSGMGGPRPSESAESDGRNPWQILRDDVVYIENWAGELVFDLDEVNTEIQLRIARVEQAKAEAEAQARAEAEAAEAAEATEAAQAAQQSAVTAIPSGSSVSQNLEFYDSMPMGWPVQGPITSRFGVRSSPFSGEGGAAEMHTGIDIAARTGTPVVATGGGTVQLARDNGGYGLLVVLDHGRGVTTWYGHNSRLLVSPGQRVNAGDVIAEVGSTGRSTGPHVHYEVRVNGAPEDPFPYMQTSR